MFVQLFTSRKKNFYYRLKPNVVEEKELKNFSEDLKDFGDNKFKSGQLTLAQWVSRDFHRMGSSIGCAIDP